MKIQLQHPNQVSQPPKHPKKRRNRAISINVDTYMAGVWTKRVERGRRCQMCRHSIVAGQQSLRYIRDDMQYGRYQVKSEKAICPDCALPILEKMIVELKQPTDQTMFIRMRKNQPQPQTKW